MRVSIIAKQGLLPILFWLVLALLPYLFGMPWWYGVPMLLLTGLSAYLFRDLPRKVPPQARVILSPLDGTILSVEKTEDPYCDRPAIRIEALTHWSGPFVLRSPQEGKVQEQWFSPAGRDLDGAKRASLMALWIRSDEDEDVVMVVNPRWRMFSMACRAHTGERVGQGRRCGFIPFGAYVEVFLPDNARIEIEAGARVTAGDTILARLVS
ncbi:MAG: hypothetical protein HUJ29_01185 [Gammaproteobacteria bacterium]|nr:hypothetical protein [Gammaproteobacteria bacterium]